MSGRVVALLGWPVAHSLSPAIHRAAYAALGLPWDYVCLAVKPRHLADAVRDLARDRRIRGANVTIPHKRAVLDLAPPATPAVAAVGAANTLVRGPDGGFVAHNPQGRTADIGK